MSASLTGALSAPAPAAKSRFEMEGKSVATREGRVSFGRDRNGVAYLVHHQIAGRQPEGIALHAVGAALTLMGADDIVAACQTQGMLAKLATAVASAKAVETAKKNASKSAATPGA